MNEFKITKSEFIILKEISLRKQFFITKFTINDIVDREAYFEVSNILNRKNALELIFKKLNEKKLIEIKKDEILIKPFSLELIKFLKGNWFV